MLSTARSILGNPSLLLLDEPLEGLAPVICEELMAAFYGLAQSGRMTILLVEQRIQSALDAGIRLGERLEKDMIALTVGPPLRVAVVASPAYLNGHEAPVEPADLTAHRCIAYADADRNLSPWSFERNGRALTVTPGRGPVFNDGDLLVAAAIEGFGVLYILEDLVAAPVADGRLIRLLEQWCVPFPGYHLYYADRHQTTAFELFKKALRESRGV
jgi:DNA-binding transcriptional LysR family regulator